MLLTEVQLFRGAPGTDRRAHARAAIAEDHLEPDAILFLGSDGRGDDAPALRASTRSRPEDPRAWLALADALGQSHPVAKAEREEALRRAAGLDPESCRAWTSLALLLLDSGRAPEALSAARRATAIAPWSARAFDALAAAAMRYGLCDEALAAGVRASALEPEDAGLRRRAEGRRAECMDRR